MRASLNFIGPLSYLRRIGVEEGEGGGGHSFAWEGSPWHKEKYFFHLFSPHFFHLHSRQLNKQEKLENESACVLRRQAMEIERINFQ